ncbi:hypothetical protein [Aeromonas diversa]|uniref:Uncharacterized protein n=1 Tax=Aeromonas diversa CDC 2478-85 TaxID=1268237 RepID=N9VPM8_9GAMM|nr:hypothetical protein [Aeromonas diversa]ENY73296.1 hypothetical protein G114_03087 [Aeromonas diversa CDC 2478-85]
MHFSELILVLLAGLILWPEAQDWRTNRNDLVQLSDRVPVNGSIWQCGVLKSRMADIEELMATATQVRDRQTFDEVSHHLLKQWRDKACDMTLQ